MEGGREGGREGCVCVEGGDGDYYLSLSRPP